MILFSIKVDFQLLRRKYRRKEMKERNYLLVEPIGAFLAHAQSRLGEIFDSFEVSEHKFARFVGVNDVRLTRYRGQRHRCLSIRCWHVCHWGWWILAVVSRHGNRDFWSRHFPSSRWIRHFCALVKNRTGRKKNGGKLSKSYIKKNAREIRDPIFIFLSKFRVSSLVF